MTTVAIVGAGPGLGAAVARRFGAEGFAVALISRSHDHVDPLCAALGRRGVIAKGYAADVRRPDEVTRVLADAARDLGPVEVLQYSPIPAPEFLRPLVDTTIDDLRAAVEFSVFGPVGAVDAVLPGMRTLGRGTVLFVNGASALRTNPAVAGTSVAFAAEAAYAQLLHDALADDGVHVAQLIIPRGIRPGHPTHDPDVLAERLWRLHVDRDAFRVLAADLDDPDA